MQLFNKHQIKTKPLSERISKSDLSIMIDPNTQPPEIPFDQKQKIKQIARQIIQAKQNNSSIILTFGAHLIKNNLSKIIIEMIKKQYITHLASNGASAIHDWELAFQGKTEEDVRFYVQQGQFGIWEETGKYQNLAIQEGAKNNLGYGESIAKMIHEEELIFNNSTQEKLSPSESYSVQTINPISTKDNQIGRVDGSNDQEQTQNIPPPYKQTSILNAAYTNQIPFTIHPCLGQDIIYTHPLCNFQAIGKTAEIDFLRFVKSVSNLEEGIYLSVGSAILSPMIFEKALSMARNTAHQNNKEIKNFTIIVNDIQPSGDWDWSSDQDPPKSSPAYYLRFCKTFHRMGAKQMQYLQLDNRAFIHNLYQELINLETNSHH